ncbi:hypothetical protein [uncultured Fusobacterium sp.]|uniref:hypothetical protein n=1 Tax=uncultured Fusobacterium sp. TaxID=159267 RepID=UPI0025996658|nr:hypothetical protein [uncultured Fusobacterium sp.]
MRLYNESGQAVNFGNTRIAANGNERVGQNDLKNLILNGISYPIQLNPERTIQNEDHYLIIRGSTFWLCNSAHDDIGHY